jgi:hypothetical protein
MVLYEVMLRFENKCALFPVIIECWLYHFSLRSNGLVYISFLCTHQSAAVDLVAGITKFFVILSHRR